MLYQFGDKNEHHIITSPACKCAEILIPHQRHYMVIFTIQIPQFI